MEVCDECSNRTVCVLYRESRERNSVFCDFTSLCVHIVTSQVIKFALIKILNNLATKGAITIK